MFHGILITVGNDEMPILTLKNDIIPFLKVVIDLSILISTL